MKRDKINLGRVGFVLRGYYDNSKTYREWDMVIYNGSSYVLISKEPKVGIKPTNSNYWSCIAIKGEKGAPGSDIEIGTVAVGKYEWRYNESDESLSLFFIP